MSERVRRRRRGLERGEKEHVALLIDCFKKRTDRRTLTPYALLLTQELAELSLKSVKIHWTTIHTMFYLNQVFEDFLSRFRMRFLRLFELAELVELFDLQNFDALLKASWACWASLFFWLSELRNFAAHFEAFGACWASWTLLNLLNFLLIFQKFAARFDAFWSCWASWTLLNLLNFFSSQTCAELIAWTSEWKKVITSIPNERVCERMRWISKLAELVELC